MRWAPLVRILFILYCIEAGTLLLLAPWTGAWDRVAVQIQLVELRGLALHPFARSAFSAFGAVHLVWAAHDLDLLLSRWRTRRGEIHGR